MMGPSKPGMRRAILFTCKFCRQEFLVPRTFVEHKKKHLEAITAAAKELEAKKQKPELNDSNQIEDSSSSSEKASPAKQICNPLHPQVSGEESMQGEEEAKLDHQETNCVKNLVPDTDKEDEEKEPCSVTSQSHVQFKLSFVQKQTWSPTTTTFELSPRNFNNKEQVSGCSSEAAAGIGESTSEPSTNYTSLQPTSAILEEPVNAVPDMMDADNELTNKINAPNTTGVKRAVDGDQSNPAKNPTLDSSPTLPVPKKIAGSSKRTHITAEMYSDHPCAACGKLVSALRMPGHRRLYHPELKPFQCFHCPHVTTRSDLMYEHRKCHRLVAAFKCPSCTFSYDTQRGVDSHVTRVHSTGKDGKSEGIPRSPSPSMVVEELNPPKPQSHLPQRNEAGPERFKCRYCAKEFPRASRLKEHEDCHTRPYKCNRCSYASGRASDVRNHKMRCHSVVVQKKDQGQENKTRAKASSSAPTSSKIPMSAGVGCPTREFKCRYCPRVFPNPSTQRQHEDYHTRPFKCSRCNLRCGRKSDLIKHEARGTCSKIDKSQPQLSCPKRDTNLKINDLLVHRLKPSAVPPYKCKECSYTALSRAVLQRHGMIHSGTRKYKCPHCTASYDYTSNRSRHVKEVHKGKFGAESSPTLPGESIPTKFQTEDQNIASQVVPARKAAIRPPGFYNIEKQTTLPNPTTDETAKEKGVGQPPSPREGFEGNWGLQCPHCDYTSFHTASMRNHILKAHAEGGKGTFNCSECPASYIHKIGLETHYKNSHPNGTAPKVDARPSPPPPGNLPKSATPKRTHDHDDAGGETLSESRTFNCRFCKAKFTGRSRLEFHEFVHTRSFVCNICKMSFSRRTNLELHLKTSSHIQKMVKKRSGDFQQRGRVKPNPTPLPPATSQKQPPPPPQPANQEPLKGKVLDKTFSCSGCNVEFSEISDLIAHAQLDCRQNCAKEGSGGSGTKESGENFGSPATAFTAEFTNPTTGETSAEGVQVSKKIQVTQGNEEGLKILSIRFV